MTSRLTQNGYEKPTAFDCSYGRPVFLEMVLHEKRKTKFAVKKYKDLKNTNDDKKSIPTTQQATVPKATAATPPKASVKKEAKYCTTQTTPKRIVTKG